MKNDAVIEIFAALALKSRLKVFKAVVKAGEAGTTPSQILEIVKDMPRNTLSFHLAVLERAGLCASVKSGKQVFYAAKPKAVRKAVKFLMKECGGDLPD